MRSSVRACFKNWKACSRRGDEVEILPIFARKSASLRRWLPFSEHALGVVDGLVFGGLFCRGWSGCGCGRVGGSGLEGGLFFFLEPLGCVEEGLAEEEEADGAPDHREIPEFPSSRDDGDGDDSDGDVEQSGGSLEGFVGFKVLF
jgi:hypothetical protein